VKGSIPEMLSEEYTFLVFVCLLLFSIYDTFFFAKNMCVSECACTWNRKLQEYSEQTITLEKVFAIRPYFIFKYLNVLGL
jgi:hypothetical protein